MKTLQLSLKRLIDIVCSLLILLVLSPFLSVVALAIRLESRGPILFVQPRVGRDGRIFQIYKFRSMVPHEIDYKNLKEVDAENPYLTRLGRILRRYGIDELPQLLNILKGDMSLVGPRPTIKEQVDNYTPFQRRRLEMRPGLTGLAQVSGNTSLPWDDRIALDVWYIDHWSLRLEILILLHTVKVVLRGTVMGQPVEQHPRLPDLAEARADFLKAAETRWGKGEWIVAGGERPKSTYGVRTRYLIAIDIVGIFLALAVSVLLRYESPARVLEGLEGVSYRWLLLPIAAAVRIPLYYAIGMYSHIWRYASVREVGRVVLAVSVGSVVLLLSNLALLPILGQSPMRSYSVFVIDWMLNLGFLGVSRLAIRIILNWLVINRKRNVLRVLSSRRKVLIAGAGDAGAIVARLIQDNPEMGFELVGYVDDDPRKQAKYLHGASVLGTRYDIPRLVAGRKVREVIVAMPTAPQSAVDDICEICSTVRVPTRVVPSIYDLLSGTLSIEQMRQWRALDGLAMGVQHSSVTAKKLKFHNILVTGGAGFIGANFVRYMLEAHPNYRIVVYDKLTYAGNLDNLLGLRDAHPARYVFVKGDIADFRRVVMVMELYEIDAIVNFAAETHVDRSLMEPGSFLETNVYGTYTLLEAARQFGIRRFHQVSTDEVYGQVLRGSFAEQDPLETRSPYSASKAAADSLVHAYHVSFGVPVTITRGSNSIGPYQYPEKVVPLFATNALDNEPLPIYGDGLYIRDYQYVLDHCRAIDHVVHWGASGEIYNIGSGREMTTLDLAKRILDKLGKSHALIYLVEDRPGQDRRYSLNCAKIKALGWSPRWTFDQALDATIQWYVENEWWWRKIKSGEYRQYYERQFSKRLERAVQLVLSGQSPTT